MNTNDRFWSVVKDAFPNKHSMPLVHISDGYNLLDICKPKKLIAQQCKVFGRDILYTFYGKPAYRSKHKGNSYLTANLPCVFIFKPDAIKNNISAVYPFDTGAFANGRYENFFHDKMEIKHFELPAEIESANQVVGHFFRDNDEYYRGQTLKNVEIGPGQFEIEAYHQLVKTSSDPNESNPLSYDDRANAIEIHLDGNVDLHNSLLACIFPRTLMNNTDVIDFLEATKPKIIESYTSIQNHSADALAGKIYEIVERIYIKHGYLNEV